MRGGRHVPEPARARRPRLRRARAARASRSCDVVFFATPNGVAMNEARALGRCGRAHHRPLRRLPPPGSSPSGRSGTSSTHAAPGPGRARRSTACPRSIATRSARRASSPTPAAIRPRCSSACCRSSRRASVDLGHLIADAKSGVSGRRAQGGDSTSCSREASDNFKAYGVAGHRHVPGDRAEPRSASPAGRSGSPSCRI